jgi:aryl-alcohol dehydrogenase
VEITAAVVRAGSPVPAFETLELEPPRAGEVLVRIAAVGVCHTDIRVAHLERFARPIVLGHEGAGVVEAVGEGVHDLKPGDRVAMSYAFCGHCPVCEHGAPAYCLNTMGLNFAGRREDGSTPLARAGEPVARFFGQAAFATYAVCDARSVIRAADDMPFELLAPLGCGVQTGAGAMLNALQVQPHQSVAVLGVGSVGLSAVMAAKAAGAVPIVAVDINPARLALALELGATAAVDASQGGVAEAVRALTGLGADLVLNTADRPEVYLQGIAALAPLGTFGFVTSPGAELPLDLSPLMLGGRSIRGIVQGDSRPREFIPRLIELWRDGRFPIEKLVTTYRFDQLAEAMADSEAGRTIKPVLIL